MNRRRLWTFAVSAVASVLILAAIVTGLFRLAVELAPGYREQLAAEVSALLRRPVAIGQMDLTWRGITPSLDLRDVSLLDASTGKAVLAVERLRLGFAITDLVAGEVWPRRVDVYGTQLALLRDAEGRLRLRGLEDLRDEGAPVDADEVLAELARFRHLGAERVELIVQDGRLAPEPQRFLVQRLALERRFGGVDLDADVTLPPELGTTASVEAELDGDLAQRSTWDGTFRAEIDDLKAGHWAAAWLQPGTALTLEGAAVNLDGRVRDGRITALNVAGEARQIHARRGGGETLLQNFETELAVTFEGGGWRGEVARLTLKTAEGPWPQGALRILYRPLADGSGHDVEIDADYLRAQDLAPWLAMLKVMPAQAAVWHDLRGELRGLVLRAQRSGETLRYSLRASARGLGVPAQGRRWGVGGISGEVFATDNGGRLTLADGPARIELPGTFATPVDFERLAGEVAWERAADAWRVQSPRFVWRLRSSGGEGRLELRLPDAAADGAARSPHLELAASFSATAVEPLKAFIPKLWGPGLEQWLRGAIETAQVPEGQLLIEGPLADFPFEKKKTGQFRLDLDVAQARLKFAPDWPVIDEVEAQLLFRGNSLAIVATEGRLAGNRIEKVTARFRDFADGWLLIDGRVDGRVERYYTFLAQSPLRDDFAGLLETTQGSGPAEVALKLEIPIARATATQATGTVTLNGVTLRYRGLAEPIRGIRGDIRFADKGLSAEGLTGQLYELALQAQIKPADKGSSQLTAQFTLDTAKAGGAAAQFLPDWLRKQMQGSSEWRAEIAFGAGAPGGLRLASDLRGVAITLPEPLAKPAAAAVPLQLSFGDEAGSARTRLRVDLQDRFGADLRLTSDKRGWQVAAGSLHAGPGQPAEPASAGWTIDGRLESLRWPEWQKVVAGSGLEQQISSLRRVDLTTGKLYIGDAFIRDSRLVYVPRRDAWSLQLEGSGAIGELDWTGPEPGALRARMARLHLQQPVTPRSETPAAAVEPSDPGKWPALDIVVEQLVINDVPLGQLRVGASRLADGLKLDDARLSGGMLEATATGNWQRRADASTAQLNFDLTSPDLAAVLRAAGFTANLRAKQSHLRGELAWPPARAGIQPALAKGSIRLDLENGTLKNVDPGAGRVLGLLNLYALPRRLTLNFKDVTDEGLAFDAIGGDFQLLAGRAHTDNLEIKGPSVRIETRGSIGLADRSYDQKVTVYPGVSSGVTLASLLIGGPAIGALVLLAQEILDKPLEQATQLSYHLGGTWDNPQVTRLNPPNPRPGPS